MLAVGQGKLGDHLVECAITFGDQAIAHVLELVQGSGFAMRLLLADVEHGADRVDFFGFQATHQFGDVLGFAFARDRLVNGARTSNFIENGGIERYAAQLGIGQRGQGFGQFEYGGRVAAQLTAARAFEGVIGFIKRHRISTGNGQSRFNGMAANGHRG